MGTVGRIPSGGGELEISTTSDRDTPLFLTVAVGFLYWTHFATGEVMRLRLP